MMGSPIIRSDYSQHIADDMPQNLFLIGYRGTGKSTVGPLVAARLGWAFVDADELTEATAGMSIKEIFAKEGETGFRNREAATLAELASRTNHVIATGGGVILRESNRAVLRKSGFVVWLSATPEAAWERIQADAATAARRPNLTVAGGLDEVCTLLATREPLYRAAANVEIRTDGLSPEAVADAIFRAWNGGSTSPPSSGACSSSSSA
jgi:shikimate kinase